MRITPHPPPCLHSAGGFIQHQAAQALGRRAAAHALRQALVLGDAVHAPSDVVLPAIPLGMTACKMPKPPHQTPFWRFWVWVAPCGPVVLFGTQNAPAQKDNCKPCASARMTEVTVPRIPNAPSYCGSNWGLLGSAFGRGFRYLRPLAPECSQPQCPAWLQQACNSPRRFCFFTLSRLLRFSSSRWRSCTLIGLEP